MRGAPPQSALGTGTLCHGKVLTRSAADHCSLPCLLRLDHPALLLSLVLYLRFDDTNACCKAVLIGGPRAHAPFSTSKRLDPLGC